MLQLKHIKKEYHTGDLTQKALDDVSLNLRDNEFVAILGPSGSGKTTLLNIIGGLDRSDSGELIINGTSTKNYKDRDWDSYRNHTIGFVFQSYNLIPHQTLLANVELALTISGVGRAERRQRAIKALEEVGLGDQIHKKPNQLSGGQMQRVAIARALVNDPDILLADEPTGALDTDTSTQVMDLLQDVAKDRLVVMVTHNPDLAERYATRIVRLQDGKITADSDPYEVSKTEPVIAGNGNMGKASMSFLTSLGLSFQNLLTKKTRTILTAFAGSIGIIGIALILSLSTGVNDYIAQIEEDTLSEYPIEITSTGFDISSMMDMATDTIGDFINNDDDVDIKVTSMLTSMFTQVESNDLSALKEYLDSGESGIEPYVQAIEYSYNITPYIFVENGDGSVDQVNPSTMLSQMGMNNSMMQNYISMDMFHILPENDVLYSNQYDLEAGRWPEDYSEGVLVLSSTGGLSDLMLYSLGLRDASELSDMITEFLNGETVETPDDMQESFTYEEILELSFKLVNSCDFYTYDEDVELWVDKSDNNSYMKEVVEEGEDLSIVGIVRPSEDANATFLTTGVYFPYSLIDHIVGYAEDSEIVQDQLANHDYNVLTGDRFGEDTGSGFDMASLLNIDDDAMSEMFEDAFDFSDMELDFSDFDMEDSLSLDMDSFDMSEMADSFDMSSFDMSSFDMSGMDLSSMMDMSSLDFSDMFDMSSMDLSSMMDMSSFDLSGISVEMPEFDMSGVTLDMSSLYSAENMNQMMEDLYNGYTAYAGTDYSGMTYDLQAYMGSEEGMALLNSYMERMAAGEQVDTTEMASAIISGYSEYASENNLADIDSMTATFSDYLNSDQAEQIVTADLMSMMDMNAFYSAMNTAMQSYMAEVMASYNAAVEAAMQQQMAVMMSAMMDQITAQLEQQMSVAMASMMDEMMTQISEQMGSAMSEMMDGMMDQISEQLSSSMSEMMEEMTSQIEESLTDAMSEMMDGMMDQISEQMEDAMEDMMVFDEDSMSDLFDFNMDTEDLMDMISSISLSSGSSYDSNLEALGYVNFAVPTEIDIYPLDFEAKEGVTDILEDYNRRMDETGQEEKMISYTDLVGTLMSSVTDIINLISYVLIAFVSISLVVSSIMIGVITYISVLERKKEIGILRAMGASKGNVSQVFTAETFIIGLCAGLMGVILSRLILIPANAIIHLVSGSDALNAVLSIRPALLLIILSVVLTVIGGLIPSRSAARSDPVAALRSE